MNVCDSGISNLTIDRSTGECPENSYFAKLIFRPFCRVYTAGNERLKYHIYTYPCAIYLLHSYNNIIPVSCSTHRIDPSKFQLHLEFMECSYTQER